MLMGSVHRFFCFKQLIFGMLMLLSKPCIFKGQILEALQRGFAPAGCISKPLVNVIHLGVRQAQMVDKGFDAFIRLLDIILLLEKALLHQDFVFAQLLKIKFGPGQIILDLLHRRFKLPLKRLAQLVNLCGCVCKGLTEFVNVCVCRLQLVAQLPYSAHAFVGVMQALLERCDFFVGPRKFPFLRVQLCFRGFGNFPQGMNVTGASVHNLLQITCSFVRCVHVPVQVGELQVQGTNLILKVPARLLHACVGQRRILCMF
mmetsp:Transcript_97690/g.188419  ORF Transcript_97690/g.188419 Transcript_97690/m.188419 type:complete len:259 (+) Transcript_97690:781-1557(+)